MISEPEIFTSKQCKLMGSRIKKIRNTKNIKQSELACILGISVDQMSNIENGRTVCKLEYVYIIEQVLDISATYLLHGETEEVFDSELNRVLHELTPDQIRRSINILKSAFL